jgi:lipopolysaccharide transport system permease protein
MSIQIQEPIARDASWPTVSQIARFLSRHKRLVWEMARRELSDRYSGQVLGSFWAIGHPLLQMGVYLFVFGFVFKVRVGGTVELPLDYTVYLLSGLIPWMAIQEAINKSTVAVSSNVNLVKQVVFPVEVLPLKTVVTVLPAQLVSTGVLIGYVLATHGRLPWTYALLPVLMVLQILMMSGVAMLLAAIGVFFRDLKDLILVFTVVSVYLLPVFYLPSMVPELFRPLLYLNPGSYLVWCFQDVAYFGRFEHPWAWAVSAVMSLGSFYAGFGLFQRLKLMFANVM